MSLEQSPQSARPAKGEAQPKSESLRPFPLFAGEWRVLSGPQRDAAEAGFLGSLQAISPESVTLKAGEMRVCKVPFYADASLWEIDVYAGATYMGVLDILMHVDRIIRLDGSSPQIHKINAEHGVLLDTSQRARDYMTFFCNAVHGDHGSFAVFPAWNKIPLVAGEHNDVLDALSKAYPRWLEIELSPAKDDPPVVWNGSTCICYSGHIFRASMALEASGMVRMKDDRPLSQGLPIRSTVYRGGLRRLE